MWEIAESGEVVDIQLCLVYSLITQPIFSQYRNNVATWLLSGSQLLSMAAEQYAMFLKASQQQNVDL